MFTLPLVVIGVALAVILGFGIFRMVRQCLTDILIHPGGNGEYFILFMLGVSLLIVWLIIQLYYIST